VSRSKKTVAALRVIVIYKPLSNKKNIIFSCLTEKDVVAFLEVGLFTLHLALQT
jgi:hypothetical protein